jgi:hypothetical protein
MACVFCAIVKWQSITISRFHLPLFVLFAPFCGVAIEKLFDKKLNMIIAGIFFILALPYLCHAYPRHLIGKQSFFFKDRLERYFIAAPAWKDSYLSAVRAVQASGCKDVGIILGEGFWEYPLWVLLKEHNWEGRMECVHVENYTKTIQYPLGEFHPCQVIVVGNKPTDVHVVKLDEILSAVPRDNPPF